MTSEGRNDHQHTAGAGPSGVPSGLTQRALGGMLWTFSGTGLQIVVQLVVLAVLGRLVTPTEFGLMGAATVVIALSQVVSQIGVGPAIIQRRDLQPTDIRVAVTVSCGLGLLLGSIVWLGAPHIAAHYKMPALEPLLPAVALLFPLDSLSTVAKSLLVRQLRFRVFAMLEFLSYVVGYALVGVSLAWLGYGVWALVFANIAQVIFQVITMYLATRHPIRPSLDLGAARALLSYGFGHSLAQVGAVISEQGDNYVVGRWLGANPLGVYGRAYNLMVMPASAFGRVVNRVLFPVMAQVQDERDRLAGAYERALAVVGLVALPLSVFLWIVAPEFIPLFLGPAWTAVVLPFRMFSVSLLFRMSSKISDACTKAAGAVYSRAARQSIFAAMVVIGAIVGQRWGVGGVAVAVSLAMGANFLAMAALGRSVSGLSWPRFVHAHVPGLLLAALLGVVVTVAVNVARAAHVGALLVLFIAGMTAVIVTYAAAGLGPRLFLGPHGIWALRRAEEMLHRLFPRLARAGAADRGLAAAGKVNSR